MSAIGDYIHYSAKAYEKYGTNYKGEGTYQQWHSQKGYVLSRANRFAKSTLPINQRKKLESIIGSIMKRDATTSSSIKATQAKIERIIARQYQKAAANIDWQGHGAVGNRNVSRDVTYDFRYNLEKIIKKINQLEKKIGVSISSASGMKLKKLNEELIQVENLHKQLLELMRQGATSMGIELNIPQADAAIMIKTINRYLDSYRLGFPPVENQQGAVFEHAIGMAPEVARGTALAAANMHVSSATYDRERVIVDQKHFTKNMSKTIGNMWVNTHGTTVEGKIDVTMSWRGKQTKISAKSYNLAKSPYVKISTGSNLIYMLQDINSDFVNHFLNIFAEHEADDNMASSLTIKRKEMFEEIKFLTFYKAISGDNYGRNTADTFVINDVSGTNGVRIYSIDDIVNTVLQRNLIDYIRITSSKTGGELRSESQLRFYNHWQGQQGVPSYRSGLSRISKLILDAHQHKLTFAFNAKQILPLVR